LRGRGFAVGGVGAAGVVVDWEAGAVGAEGDAGGGIREMTGLHINRY
jgi:hypothetical protein